jgi:hypothetical protein
MRLSIVAERAGVFILLSVLATTSVHAADPLTGRWAADPLHCVGAGNTRAQSPLIITESAVRWSGDACRIGRMYRAGDTSYIEAFCSGESRERAIAVTLRSHGDQLAVTWDRGAFAEMRRCPPQ